jgi:hypothetical protein
MNLSTLDNNMSLNDIFAILGQDATAIFASKLSAERKMARLISNAAHKAEDARLSARDYRTRAVRMFDPTTEKLETLEVLLEKEKLYIATGKDLTVQIQSRLRELGLDPELKGVELEVACKTDDALSKLVSQKSQLALDLKSFRENQLAMGKENYATAWDTYQTGLKTLAKYEASLRTLRESGPVIIEAIKDKEENLRMRDQAHAAEIGASKEVDPNQLMNELRGEFETISAKVRSDDAVDADLDGLRPVSSEDLLAEYDRKNADAATLSEFDVPVVK